MVIVFPATAKWIINDVCTRESTGQVAAATRAGSDRISFSARIQRAAHRVEQHV